MKSAFYLLLTVLPVIAFAQKSGGPDYPQDYFRNPLDIPIFLAGNFGECRAGHFHSGIDIKTLGREDQPVYAAAEGYVSRIKMDKSGFGHALYITHPNGYTTLYAHLNDFAPALQKYLKMQQYEKKRWDVDLPFTPAQFPVKKGQQIAWSGNTGGSTAPHLHFEIRSTKTEHPLNPELFGLPVLDKVPPAPAEVYFYFGHLGYGPPCIYSDGEGAMGLTKKGDVYKPTKADYMSFQLRTDTVILPSDNIGIGVNVDDYMDGSESTLAFYTAKLFMDDTLQSEVALDDIGYDVSRYINAYTDYKTRQQHHKWVQLLFELPGNKLHNIFPYLNPGMGRLKMGAGIVHKVTIEISDDRDNKSIISFYACAKPVNTDGDKGNKEDPEIDQQEITQFYVNKVNSIRGPGVSFSLDERQLYDNFLFHLHSTASKDLFSDKYDLHYPYVPVHHYFDLKIKPNKSIPAGLKNKIVMKYSDGKDEDGRAAVVTDSGRYKAAVRNFGAYWLDIDTIPPVIKSLQKDNSNLSKTKKITFEAKDAMTSVKNFSGYLDGNWVCFEAHADLIFYKFDEHCPKGKHKLVFKAEDENGNVRTVSTNFVR